MTITSYRIDEIAEYTALSQVFTNIDEDGWPLDPMRFLDNCAENSLEYAEMVDGGAALTSGTEMIPLTPYAEWSASELIVLVNDLKDAVTNAIEVALTIERKEAK